MKKSMIIVVAGLLVVCTTIILLTVPRKETIVVTIFGDFSSGEDAWANLGYQGAVLAIDQINDASDGIQFVLERLDTSAFDTESDIATQLDELHTDIIIGPYLSNNLIEYASFLMDSGYLVLIPSATHDVITNQDDMVFRFMNATSIQAHQTAIVLDDLSYEKVFLMYDTYNQMYTKEFVDYLVADEVFSDKVTTQHELVDYSYDFSSDIDISYDAIVICAASVTTAHTIETLRGLDIDIPVFITSYSDSGLFLNAIPHDVEDVYLVTNRNIQFTSSYNIFVSEYSSQYGTTPAITSVYVYEYLFMIHKILMIDGQEVSTIDEYINGLEEYKGLFLTYYNNDNGDYYTNMGLYEVINQTFQQTNVSQIN